jgi:ABC-2 type transport system permease protein
MIAAIFRLDLRRSRTILLWVGVVAFAYAGAMALIFPTLRENAAALENYLKIFPKEFMLAFGMTGSLAEPGTFFNTYIGTFLWPLLAAILGVLVATRPVAADLDRGFLELVVTTPLPRRQYLAISIVGQIVVTSIVAAATIAGVVLVGALVDARFDAARFALTTPLLAAFAWAIAAFATLMSVITLSRGIAGGVTVGVLLAMYMANVVAQIVPDLDWLASLSMFGYFDTKGVMNSGTLALGDVGLFVAFAATCWLAALALFGRRDLAA